MPRIAVATMSLARSPEEEDLLHGSLEYLSAKGLPVVVADGGSEEGFGDRLRTLPHLTVVGRQTDGAPRLVGQVQASLAEAARIDSDWILYTEPDKRWFFEHRMDDFLTSVEGAGSASVVVASRDAASFATFPRGQQLAETLLNTLCAETFGVDGDFTYGPLLIRPELLPAVLALRQDLGWGWRIFLMAVAHRMGQPVALHSADLPCPEEQRGEDDVASRIYRMEQLAQNVRGLALGLKTALDEGAASP